MRPYSLLFIYIKHLVLGGIRKKLNVSFLSSFSLRHLKIMIFLYQSIPIVIIVIIMIATSRFQFLHVVHR